MQYAAFLEKLHYLIKRVHALECELVSDSGTHRLSLRIDKIDHQTVDDLRSSLAMIGRELRSALCITQPSANGPSGNVLRFTTEANDQQYEVTYTVTNGTLLRQVTNQSQVILVGTGLTGQDAAFTYIATPRRTVKVDFTYQPDPTQPGRELSTVMAGRNAWLSTSWKKTRLRPGVSVVT